MNIKVAASTVSEKSSNMYENITVPPPPPPHPPWGSYKTTFLQMDFIYPLYSVGFVHTDKAIRMQFSIMYFKGSQDVNSQFCP